MSADASLPLRWVLVALLGLSVVYLCVRLTRPRTPSVGVYAQDTESDLTHLVMAVAMIVMFATPAAVSHQTWRWFLGALAIACGGWFVAVVARRSGATEIAAAGYHTVAAVAMLYAMSGGQHSMHAHHHMHHQPVPLTTGLPWTPATYALIVLFVVDAVTTAVVAVRATDAPIAARAGVFPHIVMDVGTAMMLVAALPR